MEYAVKNLYKSYSGEDVLVNLNIEFNDSKINVIMGPSGCGKTTLLRILTGFEKKDKGEIIGFAGKKISFVFQEDRLINDLNPIKNIMIILDYPDKKLIIKKIKNHLLDVGLSEDDFNKPVSSLSGGMARRLALVRAFISPGDIVILDEPFKGLDDRTKALVINYIKENIGGRFIIAVTHDFSEFKDFDCELIKI